MISHYEVSIKCTHKNLKNVTNLRIKDDEDRFRSTLLYYFQRIISLSVHRSH